jgi:hypothetical protein
MSRESEWSRRPSLAHPCKSRTITRGASNVRSIRHLRPRSDAGAVSLRGGLGEQRAKLVQWGGGVAPVVGDAAAVGPSMCVVRFVKRQPLGVFISESV